MFGVPTGSPDPTKSRVEATVWFLPSSVLKQLADVLVTVEVFNLTDPLLGSTSKKQPFPANGVVRVQWTRDELDKLFGSDTSSFGARIRLTSPQSLKKPVFFGPGQTKPGSDFPMESLALHYGQIEWKYVEQEPAQGGGNVQAKYDLKTTECKEDDDDED